MIKALIMDVDGTLTDGGIYMGLDGEMIKRFDVKDGYAIREMLPELGITPIVVTGRQSNILVKRCKELGIENITQGSRDKVGDIKKILLELGISYGETAYIGDDLNDINAMRLVGVKACPLDAVDEIKEICDYVCQKEGGRGAVRDFVEWIRGKMGVEDKKTTIYTENKLDNLVNEKKTIILYDLNDENFLSLLLLQISKYQKKVEVWSYIDSDVNSKYLHKLTKDEFEIYKNIYHLYEFLDRVIYLSSATNYPSGIDYIRQGILSETEMIEGLLYKIG